MALKITYVAECDICRADFHKEEFEHMVGMNYALPHPNLANCNLGWLLLCPPCFNLAKNVLVGKFHSLTPEAKEITG